MAAAEFRRGRVAHLHDVASADEYFARVGGEKPRRKMQERGLAATAWPHQRLEAARRHLQGKVLEDFLLAILAAHTACVKSFHHSSIEPIFEFSRVERVDRVELLHVLHILHGLPSLHIKRPRPQDGSLQVKHHHQNRRTELHASILP